MMQVAQAQRRAPTDSTLTQGVYQTGPVPDKLRHPGSLAGGQLLEGGMLSVECLVDPEAEKC